MPAPKLQPGSSPAIMSFRLHLMIEEIKHLPVESSGCSLMAQVQWRGSRRKAEFLAKNFDKNYTCQQVQTNGTVRWNEGFDHMCQLKRKRSKSYQSWIIALQIEEVQQKPRDKRQIIGKAKLDVAEFVQIDNERSIRIPINCCVKGDTAEAVLMVKLQLIDVQSKDSNQETLTRDFTGRFSSGRPQLSFKLHLNQSGDPPSEDSSSDDDEPDLQYNKLAAANLLILHEFTRNQDDRKHIIEPYNQQQSAKAMKPKQRSLARLLSWNKIKLGLNRVSQPRGSPLLNKACAEDGGDDIDNDRRHQSCIQLLTPFKQVKVQPEENFESFRFEDNHKFEVGRWERKKIVSRDGKMKLVTDVFFASIDQCNKGAAGGSACTVLAAVIADWLHNNPKSLPLRCQFDELVRKGSSEWRDLCANEAHKVKFSDKHFDLDTVLEAKIRPLTVVTDKSYVSFFSMEEMPEGLNWLKGEMSFDRIWNEILCTDISDTKIYIASWNDHFFVLKIERDVIYLIDTLGRRLSEGCNQAYILKFHAESAVYGNDEVGLVSEGIECCKEYIKGFLSALPLRELQQDIKRGRVREDFLHRLMQIDFHYTAPCTMKT